MIQFLYEIQNVHSKIIHIEQIIPVLSEDGFWKKILQLCNLMVSQILGKMMQKQVPKNKPWLDASEAKTLASPVSPHTCPLGVTLAKTTKSYFATINSKLGRLHLAPVKLLKRHPDMNFPLWWAEVLLSKLPPWKPV